ncbi:hypothetical protein V8F20_002695 [Naviculisporaceae sp. PSN 640]
MPNITSEENDPEPNGENHRGPTNTSPASPTITRKPPLFIITDVNNHTMRTSLFPYIQQRIHQDLLLPSDNKPYPWKEIIVRPKYSRPPNSPDSRPANCEESDKKFNWHRPTTTILSPDRIALNCFPGLDYTEHYASLVASYLALSGQDAGIVRCVRPPADGRMCKSLLEDSNLSKMGHVDVVVLGHVDHLNVPGVGMWETGERPFFPGGGRRTEGIKERLLFSWRILRLRGGKKVAYLACMPTLWGDISYHLVQALHRFNKPECLVYLGKAGPLSDWIRPNRYLATGNEAIIDNQRIHWDNILEPESYTWNSRKSPEVLPIELGPVITVSSPLCESFQWLKENNTRAEWVSCEVGHMAKACNETGTKFGYLNIVSDDISGQPQEESLANEHDRNARKKRQLLFPEVQKTLISFLRRYEQGTDA